MSDITTDKRANVVCSICSRRIRASQAALWSQTAAGLREHTHIECLRLKAVDPHGHHRNRPAHRLP